MRSGVLPSRIICPLLYGQTVFPFERRQGDIVRDLVCVGISDMLLHSLD